MPKDRLLAGLTVLDRQPHSIQKVRPSMATSLQTRAPRLTPCERNEQSYRTTCTFKELPESPHVAMQATDSVVFVTATDISVLAEWLYVMGGPVTETVLPWGQTTFTLHTSTWSDSESLPPVPVHVSVVMPSDAPVMHEIRAAVTR